MEKRNGFFGTFYSCQFCGATENPPNTPSFDERFQKAVESYCRICGEYRRLVDSSIFVGMNPEQGLSLIRDCEKKFSRDANDYLRPMDKTLKKPSFMDARKVMNSETALVFARFAEACVQLNQFQEGKQFINHAIELADPLDESYQRIFATQSEINAHINAIETTAPPASELLLLSETNKNSNTPEQSADPVATEKNAVTSSQSNIEEQDQWITQHEDATKAPLLSFSSLFSPKGRRRRLPTLKVIFVQIVICLFLNFIFPPACVLVAFWFQITDVFKRLHDLNKPNWLGIVYVIYNLLGFAFTSFDLYRRFNDPMSFYKEPSNLIVYGFWLMVVFSLYVLFAPGTQGTNRYGRSPEELDQDSLQ